MSKVELSPQKIIIALESRSPKSLTEVYRILGGTGKLSGTLAAKMRAAVPYIEKTLAENKAGTAKAEGSVEPPKSKPAEKKPAKAQKKSSVPHDSRNPFRKWDSGYGLLVDLIANAGQKGIGKEDLLKAYCKATGKDLTHAKYDLAVINSASETNEKRHGCPPRHSHVSMGLVGHHLGGGLVQWQMKFQSQPSNRQSNTWCV